MLLARVNSLSTPAHQRIARSKELHDSGCGGEKGKGFESGSNTARGSGRGHTGKDAVGVEGDWGVKEYVVVELGDGQSENPLP
ncbi:hypothetical protein HNY73_013064 [Argiope bruennichi]|uniref:Uncharacterized protein n=1 Tax=Argiope bruennichi TaxID=94029 RepID=A0A8T0F1N9_ARGBR|nr:hypothetical protein HNY73_013064 [Argiope bruennichi]